MSDIVTQLFGHSVASAVESCSTTKKPLFVYVSTDTDKLAETFLVSDAAGSDSVLHILSTNYVCLKLAHLSPEYLLFKQMVLSVEAPSFSIVKDGKLEGVITPLLKSNALVQLLTRGSALQTSSSSRTTTTPRSVEKHMSEFARKKLQDSEERRRLRALIDADRREMRASAKYAQERSQSSKVASVPRTSADSYVLSVRLLDGEMMKAEFSGDKTLMDVKRWIEAEQNINLTDESSDLPGMIKPGFPEPSHISFYSPGTRVTYSKPQELCRLRDLDLFPRLALILMPQYDNDATITAPTKSTIWRQAGSKAAMLLLALYSFFDYGVDDAHRDMQSLSSLEEALEDEVQIPHLALLIKEPASPSETVDDEEESGKKKETIKELDYSLVGSTRLGTPAPSGTSRMQVNVADLGHDDD